MTDRIEEIRARWAKATPGPWKALRGVRDQWAVIGPAETPNSSFPFIGGDADFIAHSREDVGYLLAELEAARQVVIYARLHQAARGFPDIHATGQALDIVLADYDRVTGREASDAL